MNEYVYLIGMIILSILIGLGVITGLIYLAAYFFEWIIAILVVLMFGGISFAIGALVLDALFGTNITGS